MYYKLRHIPLLIILSLWLSACPSPTPPKEDKLNNTISWTELPGWDQDNLQEAWPALLNNCTALLKKPDPNPWHSICQQAQTLVSPDNARIKAFFEQHFTPQRLVAEDGKSSGLLTGYYEPLLFGSYQADERYRYPIYAPPKDLLTIDLATLYPELKDKRVRGRLVESNRVIPYYTRAEIETPPSPLTGQGILWVDNRDDLFFLHIQGSGRVQLPDGQVIGVGYANQNGHPYVSIGKRLIESGKVDRKGMNLFTLKTWLHDHPDEAEQLLNENPSYVFFSLRTDVSQGPLGSLGVPLVAERSIAVDPLHIPLGSAVWVDSHYPNNQVLQKLVFAQDTGGAIKGELRGDFFYGTGQQAEQHAGTMKQDTLFYLLTPTH